MANLFLTHLHLIDKWPGQANQNLGIPTDGWDNTTENFNTADDTAKALIPPIPIGQKRTVYTDNTNAPGTYTMMYLAYNDYSSLDISGDFSDGNFWCAHADTTHAVNLGADLSMPPYYVLQRCDADVICDVTRGGPVAIPCSTSIAGDSSVALPGTNDPALIGYGHGWGWFWVGGVCPCKDVSLFRGTADSLAGAEITVDGLMRKGPVMVEMTANTGELFSADNSNISDNTTSENYGAVHTPGGLTIGWVDASGE